MGASEKPEKFARLRDIIFLSVVFIVLLLWLLNTPSGLMGKADATAYAVCHRIEARSFHLGEGQFPLCIRCSGMYLGAVLGLVFLTIVNPRRGGIPRPGVLMLLGVFFLAWAVDGFNSFLNLVPGLPSLYLPHHFLRLLTGTGMGIVLAVLAFIGFNQTAWSTWDKRPVLDRWQHVVILMILGSVLIAITWTQNPVVLYPLAFVSTAGVWIILTMVYTIIWLMFIRRENRFNSIRQMAVPLVAGFGLALFQIALFNLVRFTLTGTWAGFNFG